MSYEKLVNENLKLVHACAHKMQFKGIEYDELYSAGCIGLVKAAKRFDESKGFKFSTYAVPVILGEIKQLFRDNNPIKISRAVKDLGNKANKAIIELKLNLGREPTLSEIAKITGASSEEVAYALNAIRTLKSLDTDEVIERKVYISIEDTLINKVSINQLIEELNENDKILLKLRYFSDKTQNETAKIMGLSQVQVSRKEKKLLKQLKIRLSV
ncbi:MAG: sigma-70 family RNA polymerase sigma factor [Clostridia bacterium]|nr:sigma-70 family RNA polymerase sigma factor [Clostridia bacterium]